MASKLGEFLLDLGKNPHKLDSLKSDPDKL